MTAESPKARISDSRAAFLQLVEDNVFHHRPSRGRRIACHDTIWSMNAFWNSFETLLGLGVEPRDLTFVQISLRGIIVFLVTLAAVRLGHKRSLSRKTPFDAVLLVILAAVLSRAINGSAAFLRRSAAAWFWSLSIASSLFSHSIPIDSGSWSKAGLMSSCAMVNAMYP